MSNVNVIIPSNVEEEIPYQDLSLKDIYDEWLVKGEGKFSPSPKTINKLPCGYYEVNSDSYGVFLEKKSVISDELFILPSKELLEIVEDIKIFWNNKEDYKKYNFVHKRGILMHGKPGNGKSGIIQLITKQLIDEMNGIVINIKNSDELYNYNKIVGAIREIEPSRPLIVILEDIDGIIDGNGWIVSTILNLLDGVKQIDNVVYIATTNYIEQLEKRIINRPSRFDRRYEIPLPNAEVRKTYIVNKLSEADIKTIDLNQWVTETEGLSLAHIKELIISVMVLKLPFNKTLERLNELNQSLSKIEIG